MELEVGEFYLSASGQIINIDERESYIDDSDHEYNYIGFNGDEYNYKGICKGKERQYDLIAHIPEELHYDIIKRINAYHTQNIFKIYVDYAYNNKGIQCN